MCRTLRACPWCRANRELREVGLTMKIDGSGICVSQDPEPGERVAAGTEVVVTFE